MENSGKNKHILVNKIESTFMAYIVLGNDRTTAIRKVAKQYNVTEEFVRNIVSA